MRRGAEFVKKEQYAEAEEEYRAALILGSENDDLYVSLATEEPRTTKAVVRATLLEGGRLCTTKR